MSDKVKQDDKRRLAKENRALRGEDWHFGMPVEDGDEDLEEGMFMQEMMRGRMMGGRREMGMRRPMFGDGWVDEWEDDWDMTMDPLMPAFGGRAFGGPPVRHRQRMQGGGFGRMRGRQVDPARAELLRQQEVMFNQAFIDQPPVLGFAAPARGRGRTPATLRPAPAPVPVVPNPNPGATRAGMARRAAVSALPHREPRGGFGRPATTAADAARAAALARNRRGFRSQN
jgi:hypothetical protein